MWHGLGFSQVCVTPSLDTRHPHYTMSSPQDPWWEGLGDLNFMP